MHACLNVDEIMRLIAHNLVASSRKGSAVSLACCCKSFEDPVLDTLWATQDELHTLLESLPSDVWEEGGYSVSAPKTWLFSSLNFLIQKSFQRPPTTREWARFQKYARGMREIRQWVIPDSLSPETFSVIQLCTINEPLFPNLRTLDLMGIKGWLIPFIPLFLSLRTTSITLGFESNLRKG